MLKLLGNFVCADTVKQTDLRNDKRKPIPYQYKREPLNNDEVNKLTNAYKRFQEKFVIWTLLDTGLRLSEFSDLKKENIQWQERRLVIYGKGGSHFLHFL